MSRVPAVGSQLRRKRFGITDRRRRRIDEGLAEQAQVACRRQSWAVCDASALVSVFLFEGDADQAWSEAQAAGCSRALWLELARLREQDHPSEVIPIWQGEVERAIDAKNNHAYAEAVATIARIRTLMVAADHERRSRHTRRSFGPDTRQSAT